MAGLLDVWRARFHMEIEKGNCGWLRHLSRFALSLRSLIFALYAMADFNPPAIFSPTNAKADVADVGSVIMNHGEVFFLQLTLNSSPVLMNVDPNLEGRTTNTAVPPPPDSEPKKTVRLLLFLVRVHSFFLQNHRTLNQRMMNRTP